MAHPKRRQSKSRKKKRRSQDKIKLSKIFYDKINKKHHVMHNAYWYENKLVYKGKILKSKYKKSN